jgi:tetratricopeptide (TPR) repeat protein
MEQYMKLIIVVTLMILIFPLHANSQDQQSTALKPYKVLLNDGHQYFYNQQYQQALELYQWSYKAEPLDSTLYNIAICHFKLKQWQSALTAFTQLQPDTDEANLITYNTAVVYKKLGNTQKALQLFQRTTENSEDEKLVQFSAKQVEQLTTLSVTPKQNDQSDSLWYGSLNISYGVDSDVVDPVDETNTSIRDNYVETLATIGWLDNVQSRNHWAIDAIYYGTHYEQVEDYDISLLSFGGQRYFSLPTSNKDTLFLAANYDRLSLGGDDYLSNISFAVGTDFYIEKNSKLSARLRHKQVSEDDSVYEYLAGHNNQFDIKWIQGDKNSRWALGLRFTDDHRNDRYTDTTFTSYSANRYSLIASKSWRLTDWRFNLSANYRVSDYQDSNVFDNLTTKKRNDDRLFISADTEYEIYKHWSLTAEISWLNNQSNIESYDYEQTLILGGISYNF